MIASGEWVNDWDVMDRIPTVGKDAIKKGINTSRLGDELLEMIS